MADGNSYGGGNSNQPTRDRHALGDFRSHLTAEIQPTGTKQPRLSVYYHKNKVVMEVRTNVPSDMNGRERGIIRAELDPPIFMTFLAMLSNVIRSPAAERPEMIRVKRPDFNKMNGGEPVVDASVTFGKNKEGVVFLALLSANKERPRVLFPFHPGKWVEFIGADGNPKTNAEVSEFFASGMLKNWEELVPQYVYDRFVAEEFNKPGGQQGGGSNYNNNNQGQRSSGGNSGGGGADMRTEAKTEDTGNWENLPF